MTLKLKVLIILILVFLPSAIISYAIHQQVMLPTFRELENENALKNMERIKGAIDQEIMRIDTLTHDWSGWDDTYEFIQTRDIDYIKSNLMVETFLNANINLLTMFDLSGKEVWGGLLVPGSQKVVPWSQVPAEGLPSGHTLIDRNPDRELKNHNVTGVIMESDIPLLVAARPILTSSNKGPDRGTMVMGSFLNETIKARMEKQLRLEFRLITDPIDIIKYSQKSKVSPHSTLSYLIERHDLDHLRIYGIVNDLRGEPAFVLETMVLREISIQGRQYIRYGFWSIMIVGGITLLVMLIILQRTILNPITLLTHHILEIERLKDYSARLAEERHDEIGTLSKAFDRMLSKIEDQTVKLTTLSMKDELTGLANRRCFDEFLILEWKQMQREKRPISLILCDVDFFKIYNDTYGHPAGDECLRKLAQAMSAQVRRPADLVARYGGEEFAVVLSGVDSEGAHHVAETIRLAVEKLEIPDGSSYNDQFVTISAGHSTRVPQPDVSFDELIQSADTALYKAKRTGRNTVFQSAVKCKEKGRLND